MEIPLIINDNFDCWERFIYMKNLLTNKLIPLSLRLDADLPKRVKIIKNFDPIIYNKYSFTGTY